MVAITVVLAAVVFLLVQGIGDTGAPAPDMAFTKNEGSDALTVARAPIGLDWEEFTIRSSVPVRVSLNGAEVAYVPADTAWTFPAGSTMGGDKVTVCGGTLGSPALQTDALVTIVHTESNSQSAQVGFATIAPC